MAAEWELWGVNLAIEEINAAGGVLGRKLEILVMDNKCNPSEAVNVANKLVEAKVVAIEGAHCSSGHLASMKIIQDAKIPMITGIASNPQITDAVGQGRQRLRLPHQRVGRRHDAGARHLSRREEAVQDGGDRGRGLRLRPRRRRCLQGGGGRPRPALEVVSTDIHPQNTPDFTSILTRLQQRRPDAIATFQLGGDSLNFLRQAMQIGVRIPYTGRIELGGRNQPIIEAGGMEKSISAWQYSAYADSPSNKAFAEKIKAKHKAEPYLQTWAGYDCIRVLAQAIKDAGSTDGTKIKDAIKAMSFTNVMGKTVKFDEYNQAGHWVALHTVLNKKVTLADLVEVK